MSPNAEDLVFEKEIEYIHGFLDAIQLIRADANPILMRVPKEKQLDALITAIDDAYTSALEKNSENTRIFIVNHWNLERWMQQEGVTPEKYQSEEKHELEPQSPAATTTEALCPSGCGTRLLKRKFVEVFNVETMKPSEIDAEDCLYCEKCGTKWIAEQYQPFDIKKAEKIAEKIRQTVPSECEQVTIEIPKPFYNKWANYLNEHPGVL